MNRLSKIMIIYSVTVGIIGNLIAGSFSNRIATILFCVWSMISIVNLFIEIKKQKCKRNYKRVVEYFIVGISLFACLTGSIGISMFFMQTYPGSWIRVLALLFIIPPLVYFTKKYWEEGD